MRGGAKAMSVQGVKVELLQNGTINGEMVRGWG